MAFILSFPRDSLSDKEVLKYGPTVSAYRHEEIPVSSPLRWSDVPALENEAIGKTIARDENRSFLGTGHIYVLLECLSQDIRNGC